jgi:hypothetical protein
MEDVTLLLVAALDYKPALAGLLCRTVLRGHAQRHSIERHGNEGQHAPANL